MTVKGDDLTHPKNHYCDYCKVIAGKWCVSKTGRVEHHFSQQHTNRHKKADRYRKSKMLDGQLVNGVFLINGRFVPQACIDALDNLEWPGATKKEARPVIALAVIEAYLKTLSRIREN